MSGHEPKIAAAVLTHNRSAELHTLLISLRAQTVPLSIFVIDSGSEPCNGIASKFEGVSYFRSLVNLGGAGGFSLAILKALATDADWVWILDDDGCPQGVDCLQNLVAGACHYNLDLVSPIIIDPEDHRKLSFPFRVGGRFTYDTNKVNHLGLIPNVAQLFNGALVRSNVFFKIGLPQMQLFIRGDEVDFLLRLRRARVPFGTLTSAAVSHPSGEGENVTIVAGILFVLIPETPFKQYYFFRNRGYLARRYRRFRSFFGDVTLYPFVFLVMQDFNVVGLKNWAQAYWHGLTYQTDRAPR